MPRARRQYNTVVIDPPWPYTSPGWKGGARGHYKLVPLDVLEQLPIPQITGRAAQLWLWTTDMFLESAFRLLDAWGFTRRAVFVWVKLRDRPAHTKILEGALARREPLILYPRDDYRLYALQWGNGWYGRSTCEFLVLGTRRQRGGRSGSESSEDMQEHRAFLAPVGEHSRKPDDAYEMVARYGRAPRIDIFARSPRPGFDSWGKQARNPVQVPELDAWTMIAAAERRRRARARAARKRAREARERAARKRTRATTRKRSKSAAPRRATR